MESEPNLLKNLDFEAGDDDPLILGSLESSSISTQKKIELINLLYDKIFSAKEQAPERVGGFLKVATSLYKDKYTPQELKDALCEKLTPEILEDIKERSALERWNMEQTEAALHAYCTFLTIEHLWGREEALFTYQTLDKKINYAREADILLEKAGKDAQAEGRGTIIYLGARGAEVAQVISQQALADTCDEFNAQPVVAPYYRSHMETMSLDPSDNPKENFMSFDEAVSELCRIKGSPPGEGLNICVKMKINNENVLSIFHGVANVGRHILAASGYADGLRLREIKKQSIVYNKPMRADAYRNIQLKNTKAAVMISLGDGADPKLTQSLKMQTANRNPVIDVIFNNSVAIGVNIGEVVADPELWKDGHGASIPGIRIGKDDPDSLYLAMRFATTRALLDAGPTIIEVMTSRLLPHSSAHGDHLTAEFIQRTKIILEPYASNEFVAKFLENTLVKSSQTDNQILLKDRLLKFVREAKVSEEVSSKLLELADEIIDPVEVTNNLWVNKGYITTREIQNWKNESRKKFGDIVDQVFKRERPSPENATKYIKMPTPEIIRSHSKEILKLNVSEAIAKAIADAMEENPNVLMRGTDIYKGLAVVDEKTETEDGKAKYVRKLIQAGGYFKQEEGLFGKFAMLPGRMHNTPIDELAVSDYLQGMATTLTDEKSLKNTYRILYDPQYVDYGIEAWPSFHVFDSVFYATAGQITKTFGMLLLSGASAGGGFMHSHELASVAFQTPESVDVFYVRDPETTYKLLRYCLLYENNPYIFMVDKTRILGKSEEFELGTGLWTPGRARVVREGGNLQFISYGPMVNTILEGIEKSGKENIGLLDLVSLRPFPTEDLHTFLKEGSGRIIIAHQETKLKGFGNQIITRIMGKEFEDIPKKYMKDQPGPILIGSEDTPAPPSDKALLDAVVPNSDLIRNLILNHL